MSQSLARHILMSETSDGALLLALPATAERIDSIHRAIDAASTWGEFRAALAPAARIDVDQLFLDQEVEAPEDHEEFDPSELPLYEDGGFPDWVGKTMLTEVPASVIRSCGREEKSMHDGEFVRFEAQHRQRILDALAELGWTVEERSDLLLGD